MKVIFNIIISIVVLLVLSLSISFVYRMYISPPVLSEVSDENKITHTEVLQVEVLNSLSTNGLASTVMIYLRNRKFDVVRIGNYPEKDQTKSFIIDRLGDSNSGIYLAKALGIADSLIKIDIDSSLFLRCSIVIGSDFRNLKPFK